MSRKVLVIGLDGATFDVINPLMEEGWMPNLKEIAAKGACGPLKSTVPPVSAPAWLSLATGLKPETTLVYDFGYRKDKSYELQSLSSSDYAGKAIWDYLSKTGKKVGILNYPMCIPTYEVNGFMSVGLGASPDEDFTFPPDLKHELNKVVGGKYELAVGYHNSRYEDAKLFLDDLERVIAKKFQAACHLLKTKPWDFFLVVLSETDWLQHLMWRYIDKSHPLYDEENNRRFHIRFKKIWGMIDEAIGEFCKIVGKQTNVVVLSDHGFGPNNGVLKLNIWLEREGYLVWLKKRSRLSDYAKQAICSSSKAIIKSIKLHKLAPGLYSLGRAAKRKLIKKVIDQIDLARSVAFDPGHSIPFGGIYINDQLVDCTEKKQELMNEIANKLYNWGNVNNLKVDVWQKSSLLSNQGNIGPDLLVGINNWSCVMLKGRLDGQVFERRPYSSRHTGSHRMNGIFVVAGPDIQKRTVDDVHICDIAPTVLYLFNQPIPSDMDGRILREIFKMDYVEKHPFRIQTQMINGDARVQKGSNDVRENDIIQRRLKDLGYFEDI